MLCNFILNFIDDSNLNKNTRCTKEIPCRWLMWWRWRHCRQNKKICKSREREYSASISFDEIKTKLENLNGNFTLDEGDDFFEDLSYCLRFNFRKWTANVTISVDGFVTNQIQQLPWRRRWRWAEAEHNISSFSSNFQVNSVDLAEIGLPL